MERYNKIKRKPLTFPEGLDEQQLTPQEISELIEEYGEDVIVGGDAL